MMCFAPTIPVLMGGRLVVGFGVGVASMIEPIYLSEVAPIKKRGVVVATEIIAVTQGQLLAVCIALAMGRNWRLMLGIAAAPAILQFIVILFMPETQRWLAYNVTLGRVSPEEAAKNEL